MGIVANHGEVPSGGDHFAAAPHTGAGFQSLADIVHRHTHGTACSHRCQCIGHIEHAGQVQVYRIGLSAAAQPEAGAVCPQLNGIGIEICLIAAAVGDFRTGHFAVQPLAVVIVCIDHCRITPAEQQFLCLIIIFHGAVIVQVILRQVGKHRRREMGFADPLLHQPERRNLHNHIITACLCHFCIQSHQVVDKRRGVVGVDDLVPDLVLNGTDQPHFSAVFRENMLDEIGDRGLAVGTGDTNETHFPFRMPEPCGTEFSVQGTGVLGEDLPVAQSQIMIYQNRRGSLFQSLRCGSVSVKAFTPNAGEHHAGLHLSGIVRQSGDLQILQTGFRIVFQKRIQLHFSHPFCAVLPQITSIGSVRCLTGGQCQSH